MISKRYSTNGLILWAMIHMDLKWDKDKLQFELLGTKFEGGVNHLGLPTIPDVLRAAISAEIDERWRAK